MALYIISCALQEPAHDYSLFWHALENEGAKRAMDAVWLLRTDASIEAVTKSVLDRLQPHDKLFVGELSLWSATNILDEARDWLQTTLPS